MTTSECPNTPYILPSRQNMGCLASKARTRKSETGANHQRTLSGRWLTIIERKDRGVLTEADLRPSPYTSVDHEAGKIFWRTCLTERSLSGQTESNSIAWRKHDSDELKELYSTASSLHPVIRDFQYLIEGDAQLYMLFNMMFEEAAGVSSSRDGDHAKCHSHHHSSEPRSSQGAINLRVQDYRAMLARFDEAIREPPAYTTSILVAFPFNYLLSQVMHTKSGQTAFLDKKVNSHLERILNVWSEYLNTPASAEFLSEDPHHGWFGTAAMQVMPEFVETFECDPSKAHYGFCSWNDFFTRRLRPGVRPVACPDDNSVVINACESSPYRVAYGVQATDRFWIKEQYYSLDHMLAQDPLASEFYGGTVYQAYLSTFSYHRWHSPVAGRVVKAYRRAGPYFSQAPSQGFDEATPDPSQAYLTAVATRAMIFIEADNPAIGLVCFLPVGIAEVSSCIIAVKEGEYVKKGQDVGHFQHGGSTYCLIFRPGIHLKFNLHGMEYGLHGPNIPVNGEIATLSSCT